MNFVVSLICIVLVITRKDGKLNIDVYRKPTHTDRYLDYNSHHQQKHKASTARTLIHRALTLPSTEEGRTNELEHVKNALRANNYPLRTINKIVAETKSTHSANLSPEELVGTFFKMVDPPTHQSYAILPYIKGITEQLTRTLRQHDIMVASKPLQTLQQQFPSPKYRVNLYKQTDVVYKIPCGDCNWSYIGETGRAFETRKKEHMRNVKTYANNSNIASHSWKNGHRIDFDKCEIIDKGDFRLRKTLESWHTETTKDADNNSKPLPKQYIKLTKKRCLR